MKDYQKQLDIFSEPNTQAQTIAYFEKYWLNYEEYIKKWLPIQNIIFNNKARHLPNMMFNEDKFELLPSIGGQIFSQKEFEILKKCLKVTKDKYFVLIQNKHVQPEIHNPNGGDNIIHPLLRFKYPLDITWSELMSGGYISVELFQWFYKDYFVFGDSGRWGKYIANHTEQYPFNILGFTKEYESIFKKNFEIKSEEEYQTLKKWLPENYKPYIKNHFREI